MRTPSIWGPEDLELPDFEPLAEMPEGDPMLWDKEESARALAIATRFSAEYVWDWDSRRAAIRCGVDPSQAKTVGKALLEHWLVQRAVRAAMSRFKKTETVTEDTVLALVHRDASDFSPFANPIARVNAQRTLAKALGLEEPRKKEVEVNLRSTSNVLVTPGLVGLDSWERVASDSQDALLS